jgi:plastocyanin
MARLPLTLLASLAVYATSSAKIIPIDVVDDVFIPESITAAVGDVLQFQFAPHNHSVVAGQLGNPCQPATTGGFYSGFFAVTEGKAVRPPLL